MIPKAPTLLTVPETADWLKVSTWSVYEMVRQHKIPSLHVGRAIRIPLEGLMEALSSPPEVDPVEDMRRLYMREVRERARRRAERAGSCLR